MRAYFELRDRLAELYPVQSQWRRVARDSGAAVKDIVFDGAPLEVWSNILESLRKRQDLSGLRAVLVRENPEFVELADRYAQDVANGEGAIVDLPGLSGVDLTADDFDLRKFLKTLDFQQLISMPLFRLSLNADRHGLDSIDRALSGGNTNAAKAQYARFCNKRSHALLTIEARRTAATTTRDLLNKKILEIEREWRPTAPVARDPLVLAESERVYWSNQHFHEMKKYQSALARYETERASLPSLKREAEASQREVAQLDSEIARQVLQGKADERAFLDDITRARDKDLLIELAHTMTIASCAFCEAKAPFRGFYSLLGANRLLEFVLRYISEPSAASEAGRRFGQGADALVQPMRDGLTEISRGCLAGPIIVQQALVANRETLAALEERLERLPLGILQHRLQRAQPLLDQALPVMPEYADLENPTDIGVVEKRLKEMQPFLELHLAGVRTEFESEPTDVRDIVSAAQTDAAATITAIKQVGEANAMVLARSNALWDLIGRGSRAAGLPDFARKLCAALPQEFARRINISADAVLADADRTAFGEKTAQATVAAHALTRYVTSRDELAKRLAETGLALDKVKSTAKLLKRQYDVVAQKYRVRLMAVAVLSIVPGVGAIAAAWACHVVNCLEPLVTSSQPAYIKLGDFACVALTWGTIASVAVTVTSAAVSAVQYPDGLRNLAFETPAEAVAVCGLLGLLLSIRNLWSVKSQIRRRLSAVGAS